MAENKQNTTPERRPDCVTEIRMGNTVLVVSGFFKKDTTDTGHYGLGLSVAAELAGLHGGSLSVAAARGGGALFTLELPAAAL